MNDFPADGHQLIYRRACIEAGISDRDLRRASLRGDIAPVVRGAFVLAADRTPTDIHRLQVIASHRLGLITVGVVSHQSAAVMHELPMLLPDLARIHTTTNLAQHGKRSKSRHDHVGCTPPDELVEIDGVLVTSLERTAVDVACTTGMGFAGALAVFDSALRKGANREEMEQLLRGIRKGVGKARRALQYADGAAENPGESWCRAQMLEAGLPIPRLQHEFVDDHGAVRARTDFDWDGRLVGEFDGKVKYQKYLRPGESSADVVVREKKREDWLRARGIMVIRWTWDDLTNGRLVPMLREWLARLKIATAA